MTWRPIPPRFKDYKKQVFLRAAKVTSFIYQIGESSLLREPSKKVPINQIKSKEVKQKIKYLKDCLLKYRKLTDYGRAITAIQVGIPEKFSVIYTQEELIVIINPKITKKSDKLLIYPEICMSANPIVAPTIRPSWVEFKYYDEEGKLNFWKTKDDTDLGKILNRVFQHEIDHMDGIINIDEVKSPKNLFLVSDPDFYNQAKFEEVN